MEDDKILLRIKRKYTKDEEVGLLVAKLKSTELEVGMLKSENAELEYKLKNRPESVLENEIIALKKTVSALTKKVNESPYKESYQVLKKEHRKLLERFLSLQIKYNKLNNGI